ncbi:MAG TPA: thiamine phosphate synthase [Thermoanaerobaculia bacterium]|nr:thiamine phosphate synthase [Thermoanaerobaculia bacterium]
MSRFVPRTLAISQRSTPCGDELPAWSAALAAAGVDALQLREKDLADRVLLVAGKGVAAALSSRVTLLVNGRADIALAIGARGVHLPSRGVPIARLRHRFPRLVVGASTHRSDEVELARDAGADYVTFGPVYPPTSKTTALPAVGPEGLARAAALGVPVLALGGVTLERLPEIAAAGAAGVAAIGAFLDPQRARSFVAEAHRLFPDPRTEGARHP